MGKVFNTVASLTASAISRSNRKKALKKINRVNEANRNVAKIGRVSSDQIIPSSYPMGNLCITGGTQEVRNSLVVQNCMLIAVRTGLDLRSSVIYVADNYIDGAIKEELQKAKQSLTFGETLSDALLKTASRMDVAEFSTLVIAITQSIETGTSIANTLATTAAEMRNSRLLTAKEEAQKVTVKITFPMLLLIVPGVFIVLLGPVILKLIFKG